MTVNDRKQFRIRSLVLMLILTLWTGCATTESQKQVQPEAQPAAQPAPAPVQENVVRTSFEDDCRQLQQFIRSEYHQPGVKEIYVVLKDKIGRAHV